jgi:hypothetical protein
MAAGRESALDDLAGHARELLGAERSAPNRRAQGFI